MLKTTVIIKMLLQKMSHCCIMIPQYLVGDIKMKMVKCKNCGKVYPSQLSNCPECFTKNKNYAVFIGIFVFFFVFAMIMIGVTLLDNPNEFIKDTPADVIASEGSISLEEFNKIETGMTYEQVCNIIGGKGTLNSSVDLDMGDEYKTEMYSWTGDGTIGANANITFQGGKVMSKAQFGLR